MKVKKMHEAASKSVKAMIYPATVGLSSRDSARGNTLAAARPVKASSDHIGGSEQQSHGSYSTAHLLPSEGKVVIV